MSEAAGDVEGLAVVDLDHLVDDGVVHCVAEDVLADALDLIDVGRGHGLGVEVVVVDGADGVDADDLDGELVLLEESADAGDGAAGAGAADEGVHLAAVRVAPDLGAGELLVGVDVVLGVVLVDVEGVLGLAGYALGGLDVVLRGVAGDVGGGDDHLGPEALEHVDLLEAHLVGHGEDAAVALHGGPHGDAEAGVAGGVLDDGAAALDLAAFLGLVEDEHGHAVLDGAGGVHVLALDEDGGHPGLDDLVQADEGGVADGVEDGVLDVQGGPPSGPGAAATGEPPR